MVILGYHTPQPPPRWDDHHVKIIEAAHNKVIHHRKASDKPVPNLKPHHVTASTPHHMIPLHAPTVHVPDHGTATADEQSGKFFTSHRDLRSCMSKHTRIVVPKRFGAYETSSSAYGQRHAPMPDQKNTMAIPAVTSKFAQTLLGNIGRRSCKENKYAESLRVTRQRPVDTQWQNHLYMADPAISRL